MLTGEDVLDKAAARSLSRREPPASISSLQSLEHVSSLGVGASPSLLLSSLVLFRAPGLRLDQACVTQPHFFQGRGIYTTE